MKKKSFVWYATHPKDGELIMAIEPMENYKYGFLYAPRIIFDRLRGKVNALISLELNTGPLGFVPRRFYNEAGFTVVIPFRLRMLALFDNQSLNEKHDGEIVQFMLKAWNQKEKVYNYD